ncbi:5-methyltetrahydropteroyltriglutamate--homocysteine S-methyltransferase [Agrococcus sp. SL85]|uniref:5-methyltetrahydropteroyltriglutamate-- homocysteine S-methyltransferase n=1 Tax=Agrococcus sp. SL85 TaxID=2995141 RepID=UPI00226CFAE0|nr:5-methyltetrahydropteroyltriglutamate--homocysteine S-methyltransferase [Agrococcus sp. SL85]WAC66008.1 5-methyltetrahydropteroyltriglutamate--homocysteine S-methyltransferase [Agrococcus sp. SL85]
MSTTGSHPAGPFPGGTILGYPRIGRRRELKRALEAHWRGAIDDAGFHEAARANRVADLQRLVALGLDATDASIPVEAAHYDHVLDATITFGAVPPRLRGRVPAGLAGEWLLARGAGDDAPLEMTKWLDSNYHYLVPELDAETAFSLADTRIVDRFVEAGEAGVHGRPVVVGPATYLALSKATGVRPIELADRLVPAYAALGEALAAAGATWVQVDEPALVADLEDVTLAELQAVARRGAEALRAAGLRVLLHVGHGDSAGRVEPLAEVVDAIAVDLVRGSAPAGDGALVAGVVHGRNVWRTDLDAALDTLRWLAERRPVSVGTSTSLQHVPHDLAAETSLEPRLVSWLAFADQKVEEVVALAAALRGSVDEARFADSRAALADRASAPGVRDGAVRDRLAALPEDARERAPYAERDAQQRASLELPPLPTTTIGSFPQTGDIRVARARHARGELDDAGYREVLRAEVRRVVVLQEELGLDVLVHGEPERNDMVQYFAEHFDGFAATEHGWVQSYGSRATRPSILWGDVSRPEAFTVEWIAYAQSLTDKVVKGMLTGPVTILAWSFVRDDQPLDRTADQVALALADEIADLEAAGIRIVQVDEPALRELLPLRREARPAYLEWSVGAFRLATAGAAPATQIHTHLCYSEFNTVVAAIDGLDADVTSIEAARSKMEIVEALQAHAYGRGIGPGVYDIHSPRVPGAEELDELLATATAGIPEPLLWVNPDCGLKTRGYDETVESLRNLVEAAERARAAVAVR